MDSDDEFMTFDEIMDEAGVPREFLEFWKANYSRAKELSSKEDDCPSAYGRVVCDYYETVPTKTIQEISKITLVPEWTIRTWIASQRIKGVYQPVFSCSEDSSL